MPCELLWLQVLDGAAAGARLLVQPLRAVRQRLEKAVAPVCAGGSSGIWPALQLQRSQRRLNRPGRRQQL